MTISLNLKQFSGSADGPHLLITGGVHGDEFEPMAAIRRLIELFESGDDILASFRGCVTLIPIVNESAFLRGHRCGEDGLDLARTCPGRPDGSITEQTAFALSEQIRQADYYIDLHTGGTEYSVSPLAGYVLHEDANVLDVQRRMARAFNLPIIWGTAPNLEGRSLSVARDANVPAIYCEYLGAGNCSTDGINSYLEGCLNVMGELELLDRQPPVNRVQHLVEDNSSGSGHMQVCNPSPVTGFFEASVNVGDTIEVGHPLGTVYELNSNQAHTIDAQQAGLVLTLRTFPRVAEGDSVGVILEL